MAIGEERKYNYATILYKESALPNFEDIISNWHVKAFLSPLHDRDVMDDKVTLKKEHWHLLVMFDNGQYPSHVKEMFVSIGGVGIEPVKSKKSYARYLIHLDNKDKAQYSANDVKEFGGALYKDMIEGSANKSKVYAEIMDYIDSSHLKSYAQLLRYARHFEPDWFAVLCKNGMVVKDYLRSNNWDDEAGKIEVKDSKPWMNGK